MSDVSLYQKISTPETFARVLDHYGMLEGDQPRFKIVCPFHDDVNASLLIDMEQASWFCFGCHKGGTAFDLVKACEKNKSDMQCWQLLYSMAKGQAQGSFSKFTHKAKSAKQIRAERRQLYVEAQDYYFNLSAVDWTKERGEEASYLFERGFTPQALNKVGAKLSYNTNYPIVFPMNDSGRFAGWVCRAIDPVIAQKRKYLYNKGFSRRNTIVGNYKAEVVMLVEGFMDYLKAKQFGIVHAGALLGWKATDEQIQKLKDSNVKLIISALDNDKCGKDGTLYLKKFFDVVEFQYPAKIKDLGDMDKQIFEKARLKTKALRRNRV